MIDLGLDTKYHIDYTIKFKKQLKKILKQGYDVDKLLKVVMKLANLQELDCIYKYVDDKLILLLFATGSHSSLFKGSY